MTDIFDRAQERDAEQLLDALTEQARRAGLEGKTIDDSAINCRVCGDRIPDARRRFLPGVQTCVECQKELEQASRFI